MDWQGLRRDEIRAKQLVQLSSLPPHDKVALAELDITDEASLRKWMASAPPPGTKAAKRLQLTGGISYLYVLLAENGRDGGEGAGRGRTPVRMG